LTWCWLELLTRDMHGMPGLTKLKLTAPAVAAVNSWFTQQLQAAAAVPAKAAKKTYRQR
jgi:hypothetical protein